MDQTPEQVCFHYVPHTRRIRQLSFFGGEITLLFKRSDLGSRLMPVCFHTCFEEDGQESLGPISWQVFILTPAQG